MNSQTYYVATEAIDINGVRAFNEGDEVPREVVESRLLEGLVTERERAVVTIDTPEVQVVDAVVEEEPDPPVAVKRRRPGSAFFRDGTTFTWDDESSVVQLPRVYADELLQYGEFAREGEDFAPELEPADEPDLESLKKADLVALAESRGVDSSGTAAELRERLSAPAEVPAVTDETLVPVEG